MIGRLSGVVAETQLDGSCILDVGGVGYELFVPLGTLGRLPQAPERVTLHVHTHVREDAFTLFGFATLEDRTAFRALLSVSGIGPKLALSVLSQLSASELADAVARQDKARFRGISGVGKKLVERLVLELKDKLSFESVARSGIVPLPARAQAVGNGPLGVVHGALVQMGFKPPEADRAVSAIEPHADGKPAETLLREALAVLS